MAMHEPPEEFWSGLQAIVTAANTLANVAAKLAFSLSLFMDELPVDQLAGVATDQPLAIKRNALLYYEQKQLFAHCAVLCDLIQADEQAALERLKQEQK